MVYDTLSCSHVSLFYRTAAERVNDDLRSKINWDVLEISASMAIGKKDVAIGTRFARVFL